MIPLLGIIGGIILVANIPFGYWRANVQPLSRQWFFAVHLPVPVVIALRLSTHLGWHIQTFVVLIGFYSAGQYLGGRIRQSMRHESDHPLSSCLVMDVYHQLMDH